MLILFIIFKIYKYICPIKKNREKGYEEEANSLIGGSLTPGTLKFKIQNSYLLFNN